MKFLYHISSELWGHRTGGKPGNEKTGASRGLVRLANPPGNRRLCPYRKPTQVDEERILRPAGEALLRNSAK